MHITLGKYKHYKGGEYEVIANALNEADQNPVVVYKSLNSNSVSEFWVRPLSSFTEKVTLSDGQVVSRFEKID